MTTILGIDPGLVATGFAVLIGAEARLAASGTIRPLRTLRGTERHVLLLRKIQTLIVQWTPGVLAVEDYIWMMREGGNPVLGRDSMCKLVGGIFALSLMPPYPLLEDLLPQKWGAQLLGGRHAQSHTKAQIAWAVNARLGTRFEGSYHDNHECDAVGIALVAHDNLRARQDAAERHAYTKGTGR